MLSLTCTWLYIVCYDKSIKSSLLDKVMEERQGFVFLNLSKVVSMELQYVLSECFFEVY